MRYFKISYFNSRVCFLEDYVTTEGEDLREEDRAAFPFLDSTMVIKEISKEEYEAVLTKQDG